MEIFYSIRSIIPLFYSLHVILWQSFRSVLPEMLSKCWRKGGFPFPGALAQAGAAAKLSGGALALQGERETHGLISAGDRM